jgi:hypothetical protein
MRTGSGFWYLSIFGERYRRASVSDGSQRDLRAELSSGKPIAAVWNPPPYEISGNGPWPDWMAFWVPLLSQKAVSCLQELIAPCCELLPWISEARHEYCLVNITTTVSRAHWSSETSSCYGGTYASADVITVHGIEIPELFMLEGYSGKVFVSDAVARRSVDNGLKGVAFVHPRIPEMHLPFVGRKFGRKGTGFIYLEDDPAAEGEHLSH